MMQWRLHLELLEDLHVGTGLNWGDVDALQARDRHGRPVIPASHIKGLWRDAAEEWQRWEPDAITREDIAALFGDAGGAQGRLVLTSAYLASSNEPTTLLWGSTRISASGTAEEGSLRFVEYVSAGTSFQLDLQMSTESDRLAELLAVIIGRCSQLGGAKTRGHGLVHWQREPRASSPVKIHRVPGSSPRLRLLLRNLDPLCLPQTGHPGNLISTGSIIPGRSLRGALVKACLEQQREEWAQELLGDTLSYGNALPLPQGVNPEGFTQWTVLPIPFSIQTPKAKALEGTLPWWAQTQPRRLLGTRGEVDRIWSDASEKLKRPKEGEFLFQEQPNGDWQRYQTQTLERLHTRVPNPSLQRDQALFSTEELAENTYFLADLYCTEDAQWERVQDLLNALQGQWLRLGRGGRPVEIVAAGSLPQTALPKAQDSEFVFLLESDLVARNPWGNFTDRLDAHLLAELVGMPELQVQNEGDPFSEAQALYGFQAMTGLPRQAQFSIRAGSVLRVGGPDAGKLRAALHNRLALGENPEEGLGRFRLDPRFSMTNGKESPPESMPTDSFEERLCAKARAWAERFHSSGLSKSQLGSVRSRAQAAYATPTPQAVAGIFQEMEEASRKYGGIHWQRFTEAPEYKAFREEVTALPIQEAVVLLDYFTRWLAAEAKP